MNKRKQWMMGMLVCLLCGMWGLPIKAAPKEQLIQVSFSDMVGSSEDAANSILEPKLVYEEKEDRLRISFRSVDKPEGYYTATVFKDMPMELERRGGIAFEVSNPLMVPIRMNFALSCVDERTASVKDGYYVKLQRTESEDLAFKVNDTDYAKVEYGCFEIPARFQGTVEIPLEVMEFQTGKARLEEKQEIWGYGILCVVQENQYYELEVGQIRLLEPAETIEVENICGIQIIGEEKVLRPRIGESETQYHCTAYNMLGENADVTVKFSLDRQYEGVRMEESGSLVLEDGCLAQSIDIRAESVQGLVCVRSIEVYESWTNTINTENGYDASLAQPSEIAPIVKWDKQMQGMQVLWGIRGGLTAGGILFMGHYLWVRRKNKGER